MFCGSFLIQKFVVKFAQVPPSFLKKADGARRMAVEDARQKIGGIVPPDGALFADAGHAALHKAQHMRKFILRVLQEAQKQLHAAVARAPSHARYGRVEIIDAQRRAFDGVRKGELLIVVRVDADGFPVLFARFEIALCDDAHLFGVDRAVAVDDIDDVCGGIADEVERQRELMLTAVS